MTKQDVIDIIIKHCQNLNPNNKGYVEKNNENDINLIYKFDNWQEIKKELGEGQGSELKEDKDGVIKFNAVHSSSALCVNNFAPFKQNKDKFAFLNYTDFTEATFEKKLPTGMRGTPPHLDFYLETKYEVIGFESKFTEILNNKKPDKDDNLKKYQDRKNKLDYLSDTFFDVIQYYIDFKDKMYLDVAQLIKHSIGLIKRGTSMYKFILNAILVQPILVYIYWQPKNWYNFEVYRKHADEINDFKEKIQRHLIFIPISYLDFWKLYENDRTFGEHIDKVKARYCIGL